MFANDLRFVALSLATAALSACGGEDELGEPPRFAVYGCESLDASPCDVRASDCQVRLFHVAACLRGEEVGTLPPIKVISEDDYVAELERRAAERQRPNPDHEENALRMFGLVVEGALQPEAMIRERARSIGGFYRPESKEIVVVDHGVERSSREELSLVFVHEALHALQGRTVDLEGYFDDHGESDDSLIAARAMVEGEARFYDTRYLAYLVGVDPQGLDWELRFQRSVELDEEWTVTQLSRFTSGTFVFPYAWGARYLSFVFDQEGQQGIAQRLVSPPKATHTLIASEHDAFAPELEPASIPFPAGPDEWLFQSRNTLGAWGVLLASARMEADEAHALALAWRGDAFFIYAHTGQNWTAAVWKVELADAASAQLFANALRALGAGGESRVFGARVVFAANNGGQSMEWAF